MDRIVKQRRRKRANLRAGHDVHVSFILLSNNSSELVAEEMVHEHMLHKTVRDGEYGVVGLELGGVRVDVVVEGAHERGQGTAGSLGDKAKICERSSGGGG